MGIRHTALLRFYDNATTAQIALVTSEGAKLPAQIPQIQAMVLGADISGKTQSGAGEWSYAYVVDFASKDDLRTYIASPIHAAYHDKYVAPIMANHIAVDISF